MRLLVRPPAQNALFRRMRLSSPGQTWRQLTEKRTLPPAPHGKMHSATYISRKGAFWPRRLTERRSLTVREIAECAFPSRCGAREVWGNPPPGCGALWRMPQLGKRARATPPPGCGAGCARARKSRFGVWPHGKAHSARPAGFRMRFSVTTRPQTALFRRMRLSSPGQTWRQLTEKRTLPPAPHGKAHSGLIDSRKSAFCVCWRTPKGSRPCLPSLRSE